MSETIRFFFDFVSPYTYLAATQIDAFEKRTGAKVEWIPAFLAGIMKETGNQPPATLRQRGAYLSKDLVRWAAFYGVPFKWSSHFPINPLPALRAACAVRAKSPELYRPFVDACFQAAWAEDRDLVNKGVLTSIAEKVGVGVDLVLGATDVPEHKEALKIGTNAAIAAGAFGLPAFVIGEDELYFGNDRLELLAARLARGSAW